ncbi:hypothetical protein [Desulfobacula phenolica]|uniref:Uncharacterized protein n=1 Tax=Desulfobacula phenolica TaxID=90732 RepID=A0A1H2JPR8_9BACT|nr:hypothetical protein [Desulfobacula phenolica]SDU58544.1 hypothetical protein SAMN04487931_11437 [Desulfobacula phenolica]
MNRETGTTLFIFFMKVFKNPNSDFQPLSWANPDEMPGQPMAVTPENQELYE